MSLMTRNILIAILIYNLAGFTHGEDCSFFKEKKANTATDKIVKGYQTAEKKFKSSLESAKKTASQKGDLDEVKRIEAAMEGESITDFTLSRCKSARKTLDNSMVRLAEAYIKEMGNAMKSALKDHGTDGAEEIEHIVQKLERAVERDAVARGEGKVTKFVVYANKDWQDASLEVEKGDTVFIEASGKWSNGARKRVGKRKWEYIYGDADTVHFEARVDKAVKKNLGKSESIDATKGGKIEFRMTPYRKARRGDANGALVLKIRVSPGLHDGDQEDLYLTIKQLTTTIDELSDPESEKKKKRKNKNK